MTQNYRTVGFGHVTDQDFNKNRRVNKPWPMTDPVREVIKPIAFRVSHNGSCSWYVQYILLLVTFTYSFVNNSAWAPYSTCETLNRKQYLTFPVQSFTSQWITSLECNRWSWLMLIIAWETIQPSASQHPRVTPRSSTTTGTPHSHSN